MGSLKIFSGAIFTHVDHLMAQCTDELVQWDQPRISPILPMRSLKKTGGASFPTPIPPDLDYAYVLNIYSWHPKLVLELISIKVCVAFLPSSSLGHDRPNLKYQCAPLEVTSGGAMGGQSS